MYPLLSRATLLLALAACFTLAACDETDPAGPRPILDDPDPDPVDEPEPVVPVEIDAEALAAAFGCDVTAVANDVEVEAEFGDTLCTLGDGRAVAYYAFGVDPDSAAVTVDAGSAWFDTTLGLYGADGVLVAENDDLSTHDTNSRIEATLARGVYVAAVSSFDGTAGEYRLFAKY